MDRTDIEQAMEDSLALYRRLKGVMDAIEKRLPLCDATATARAAEELGHLQGQILDMDRKLLQALRPEDVAGIRGQMERRRILISEILEQNRVLLPKLKSRLAGYRTELLKIRSGITSMQGYQHNRAGARGGRIDTVN